jgi:hypothetical protein
MAVIHSQINVLDECFTTNRQAMLQALSEFRDIEALVLAKAQAAQEKFHRKTSYCRGNV